VRVLIVTFYFPPAGGGGVQRVLKLCRHLPALGVEVDVLAPDDPKFEAHDPELAAAIPADTTVHRAPYRGPSQEVSPAARLAAAHGLRRVGVRTAILGRGLLLPDPEVAWVPAATRAARRIVKERGIDVVLTTSPPSSVHLVGSALRRSGDVRWVADLRDSWLANPHRRYEKRSVRAKRSVEERLARRILRRVDAVAAVTQFIADEARALVPAGTPLRVVPNGVDFEDFAGLAHRPSPHLRIVHTGSFFGQRSPRPFLGALRRLLDSRPDLQGRVEARFLGAFRPADLAFAEELQLGDALRIEGFRPHAEALAAMKDADVLLLLIPRAGGRGLSILSGKVYEYLAAERPILALVPPEGAAANLLTQTGSGWVADPDDEDAIAAALGRAADEWEAGRLDERTLPDAWRERLDRRARAAELAELMRG
jgi:glycosyltransferase involved in cell wall biosynthesis